MSSTHTVTFHRVLRCPPERLWRAFTMPEAFAKWLPPHGFFATVHAMDVQVGGAWRMAFTNLTTGGSHSFGGRYLTVEPGRLLSYTATFDDPQLPGEMTTTVRMEPVFCGTELHIEQRGIPAVIPPQACVMGWQESLQLLAQLAEPEIAQ
ncbi:SRPBCC family protein [Roseateles sp. BYS87W]|uniref:SRPBCC family protein n=1 Tax=Pelomonas baiyunensis TaxID=3299026 RepID=A0ABW7GZC7_9BURK